MNWTSTSRMLKNILFKIGTIIAITLLCTESYAQTKNYALITPSSGTVSYSGSGAGADMSSTSNAGSVTAAGNAAIVTPSNPASLSANYFNLLGLITAEGEAWLQLKYAASVSADKTTYIRFDQPTTSGLSLDLLDIVGDLTGLLRKNLVQVDAYTGATSSGNGTKIPDANVTTTIVKNAAGQTFFAVKSSTAYNSVRVRLRFRGNLLGLALGASVNMNVYTAFNFDADNCGTSIFTNVGDAGLNVSLTNLVINPQNAIDGNLSTFSQLQSGLVSLGGSVSQTIYFNGPSSTGDVAKIVLSQGGTVLSLDVLKTITIQAYNGNTLVGTVQSASNLLNLQLLTSLSSARFSLFYSPPGIFDRIKISVDNTLNVGGNILLGGLNIHEVQRTVAKPLFAGTVNKTLAICGGSGLTLSPLSQNPAFTYNYYKKTTGQPVLVASATTSPYTEAGLAAGTYTYYIAAQKSGCAGESDLDSVIVTVKPILLLSNSTLANATVSTIYIRQIIAATGGTPAYTYAIAAGSTLPAGLALSSTGLITGTPTAAGTFTFSITTTDSFGCSATTAYNLLVTSTLTLPAAVLPNGTVGTAYPSTTLPTVTGGTTPYTYAATGLPPGLVLNASTGIITGNPTLSGTFTFPVTVTDADMNTVTTSFTIIVRDPLLLPAATLSGGTTNVVYPVQTIPSASGGSGVYAYTASGLPPGLAFNSTTREIAGTPTQAGTYTVTVNVSDGEGKTATANYTIVVKDPLLLATKTLADGTVGTPYTPETIPAATGGTLPYSYTAVNLPPGLAFNTTTRVISGTPTQSGTFTIQVTVTDGANQTLTVPYTLKVIGVLNLPAATLPTGIVGTSYSAPALPAVTGGTSPYTYSIANLPAGLTFNTTTRVISGTPTIGGNFSVTMTATDNTGLATSTDYALTVNVGAPVIAGATVCSGNPVTLIVNNTTTGVNYRFYGPTGNTILTTGPSYTVSPVETTTYYVEAFSGTAVSARIAATVTVNPTPALPVVTTNNISISSGQTATLQATAGAGETIKWYAAATGGPALGSGGAFTTPALSLTTTYYAGTENTTGCPSAARVPVLVTVTGGVPNPNCNAATSQQSDITGGLCLLCSIQGPGNSVDANTTNYTQITLGVSVGSVGYQRLRFQTAGVATDSIRLDLETPVGLLDLTVLGGITVNVMNGGTVVKTITLSSSLVNLSLLGGNRFQATLLAGAVYDRVEVRFSPTVAALSSLRIYGAEVIFPNPVVVSGNQTICSGTTASLSATPVSGTTLTWYSAATAGSILANGNTYTTPALTATTTYYIEVSKNGCVNKTRVPVIVTVTPAVTTPILAAISPVCAGSNAVLAVDNPQTGITYNWYTALTGGAPVFTGPVYTISGLTANATYYVEAANGTCLSPVRAVANIIVNPRPVLPQLQASATTVNQGQTVSLTASSTETDVVFNWYDSSTATTPVFTGPTYVTPPLSVTTTFYVEATSTVSGCASPSRVQQTITVNGNGTPVPVLCETPVSQTNGVTGTLAILARVDNPGLAIDGDQETGSTLTIPVGLNASVFQKVNFIGLSNVGDTVRIRITPSAQLLSLSVLGGTTITTYQGTTSNNDGVVINNPVINLQLLNGGTEAILSFVPAARFDAVELRLNSGLLGALTAVNFDYAQRITKAPEVSSSSVTACLNATATLTVTNPQPGIVYKWYNAASVFQADGASFTTPVITADTQFFVEASRGGCGGSRTTVNVTLIPAPQVPVLISATEETCINSNLTLAVQNPQAGVIYQWYLGAAAINGAMASTYNIINIQTSATYAVEAINSCGAISARASVAVTVGILAAPTIIPASVTINSGDQTVLTANSSTSDLTFNWYTTNPTANPAAVPVFSSTNGIFVTPQLTSTTTYYVIAKGNAVGSCESAAASVTVNVNTIPANPGSVPCEPAISQTNTRGGLLALLAGVSNPGLAIDDDIATSSSLYIPLGVGTFVSQKANFNGPSQPGDKVRIRLTSPASLLSLAVAPSITVATYNGAVKSAEMVISNPLINLQLLGAGQDAIIEFTPADVFDAVEVRLNSGVLGALTSINFNYAQRIITLPAVVSANVTSCEGISATLAVANPASGITYRWYKDADFLIAANSYQTPSTLTAGTYNYFVSANRNGCESARTPVTLIVTPSAPAPVASTGNPVSTCLNTPVTLHVDQVTGVTYNWYDAVTAGNLLAANTSEYTTPANLGVGTTTFYVEAVNGNSCVSTSARTAVSITINPPSVANDIAVVGADLPFCTGTSASLTASSATVTNPVFTWYSDAALANPIFTGAIFNIPSVTATTTYYVTVRGDNKCENTSGTAKAVIIQVNPPAAAADITISGIPDKLCAGSPVILTANSTTVTNPIFTWYTDAALTNAVFTGPVYTILSVPATINYYVTVRGTNKCANASGTAKVVILVVNPPSIPSDTNGSGNPASVCSGTSAKLTVRSTSVINPVFTWYTDAALTNAVFTGPVYDTPLLFNTTTYYVSVSGDNKCPNLSGTGTAISVIVNPTALAADITVMGNAASICSGAGVNLTAASTTVTNPVFTWYTDAALTNAVFTGPNYNIASLTATTTYYVSVAGANKCANLAADARIVTVVVKPVAVATDVNVTGNPVSICTGSDVTLTATSTTVINPVFTWYSDVALTNAVFTGATYTITGITATTTYYVTVSGDNKCENVAGTARTVTVNVKPAAVAADVIISGNPASICSGASLTLTASSTTVTNPIFTWYTDAALTNAVFTGAAYAINGINATTTYYVTVRGNNTCENAAGTARTVTVTVKPAAVAADIMISGVPANICAGTSFTLVASSSTVTNPVFTWYTDAALTNAVFTGATYNITSLSATTTYYVTVRGDNKCENITGTSKPVTIIVKPAAVAADILIGGIPANICSGSGVTLTASSTTVTNPVFTWYTDASLTSAVFTGPIFNIPALNSNTIYYVTVEGSNKCGNTSGTAHVAALIVNPVIVFNDGTLNNGITSVSYSAQISPATGGTPGYTYSLAQGSTLPAGLSLSASGVVTGRPTALGDYTFSVIAIDSKGCTAQADFTLSVATINMTLPPMVLPDGIVGSIYVSQTLPAAVGGTSPFTYTATGVPSGLTFNPITREITGTPTLGGTFIITVTVTDANGLTATQNYTLVVRVPAPQIAAIESCSGSSANLTIASPVNGVTYNWYADATGGTILYTGTSFQTPVISATTTYYVEGESGTASSSRTAVTVTISSVLSSPLVAVLSSTESSIVFTWTSVRGAVGYEVSTDGGTTWETPGSGANGNTHMVSGLQNNATVTLLVRALGTIGCQTSAAATVTGIATDGKGPVSQEIYIPNTFTPNGDGRNDVFFIYGSAIAKVKMRIYNQWGQFMFESQQQQNGWDGSWRGQMQPNGVYVYYIDVEMTDGTKTMRKGTITLLR